MEPLATCDNSHPDFIGAATFVAVNRKAAVVANLDETIRIEYAAGPSEYQREPAYSTQTPLLSRGCGIDSMLVREGRGTFGTFSGLDRDFRGPEQESRRPLY
jgi:hypothetical protein